MQNVALNKKMDDDNNKKAGSAFRTISEVADELNVQQHVLRFWETKFSQIRPMKRGGGRRYYRPEDVALLQHIHNLLYTEGYTIKGVQKLLKGQSKSTIVNATELAQKAVNTAKKVAPITSVASKPSVAVSMTPSMPKEMVDTLEGMLNDLKELRSMVS